MSSEKVRLFFDTIAADYSSRYLPTNPFLHYFHVQRLNAAAETIDFEDKRILDVGAGSGALYDFIKEKQSSFSYYACDISSEMKQHSSVPDSHYFVGSVLETPSSYSDFDYVFLLGLTTYLSKETLKETIAFLDKRMSSPSELIVTFTNKNSIDFRLRTLLMGVAKLFLSRKKIIAQDFSVLALSEQEAKTLLSPYFIPYQTVWLNQTFPVLNRVFPKFSVKIAQSLPKNKFIKKLLPYISSDYLLKLKKV